MNDGKITQIGTPQEVYEKPATPFVAGFIGDTNLWRATVIDAAAGVVEVESGQTLTVENNGLSDGDIISISVRPEQINIAHSLNDSNIFTATVSDQIYQGNDVIYEVETEVGEVMIRQSAKKGTALFDADAAVEIGFNPSSTHLIPEDPT
jgi:ABC-type Fe3+/spermidine/putrescine transport system ATPase subunit